jgi:hypothetical protein
MSTIPNQRPGDEESGPGEDSQPHSEKGVDHESYDPRIIQPIGKGYREIAHLMAYKDSPFAMFRRFGQLNMMNLLCLQGELMQLQSDFRRACIVDDEEVDQKGYPINRGKFAYSFIAMKEEDDLRKKDARRRRQWQRNERQARILAAMRHGTSESDHEAQLRILESMTHPASDINFEGDIEDATEPLSQYELLLEIRKKVKEYSKLRNAPCRTVLTIYFKMRLFYNLRKWKA